MFFWKLKKYFFHIQIYYVYIFQTQKRRQQWLIGKEEVAVGQGANQH